MRGFTLIEAIVAMTITGILAGMVAVFIKKPIEGYFATVNRASLIDTADTALRRISRDVRTAVPNTVRVSGTYVEFLPTASGGRYRSGLSGDILDFDTTGAESSFDVLGPSSTASAGDYLIIFNTGQCSNGSCNGTPTSYTPCAGANAYEGCNRRLVCTAGASVTFSNGACPAAGTNALKFPFDSPSKRFHVVSSSQQAVTYGCSGVGTSNGTGTGSLTRYWGYGLNTTQTAPPTGGSTALLATNVSACSITYTSGVTQRDALVTIALQLTLNSETVSLYHEIHVNNAP